MLGVEPCVRLVEQPQLRAAGHEDGQRDPSALAGRKGTNRGVGQPASQPERLEGRPDRSLSTPGGPHRKVDVLTDAQVVVEGCRVPEQADPPTHGPGIRKQVGAEDFGTALDDGQEAGTGAQEAGLPGPVGSLEQHDLTPVDVEVDAGQDGEAPDEGDGAAEADGGADHDGSNGTSGPARTSIQGP